MKARDYIFIAIAVVGLGIIIGQLFYNDYKSKEYADAIKKVVVDKKTNDRQDSVYNAKFKMILDSLQNSSAAYRDMDLKLDNFNKQQRKQNEKLEKIYNSIPAINRPDF